MHGVYLTQVMGIKHGKKAHENGGLIASMYFHRYFLSSDMYIYTSGEINIIKAQPFCFLLEREGNLVQELKLAY
jgi:hypothetical protein